MSNFVMNGYNWTTVNHGYVMLARWFKNKSLTIIIFLFSLLSKKEVIKNHVDKPILLGKYCKYENKLIYKRDFTKIIRLEDALTV